MTPPEFISTDVNLIVQQMIADYEQRTGRTLQPAQVERLLIDAFAYREGLVRERIQYAATQNLVRFAAAPVLDYLGELLGVSRQPESAATVALQFTIVAGHGGVTIPQGTRVATADGVAVFRTVQDVVVPPLVNIASVDGECVTTGTLGNGRAIGTVVTILDPQPFLSAVTNTSVSGGGAAIESDDSLRERIMLAPASFSVAGPAGAYRFYARSASPSIIDVAVIGPNNPQISVPPGEVHIYPLMADGAVTPTTVLNAVFAACNDDKVRPLTDLVQVFAPNRINYSVRVDATIYQDADPLAVQAAIQAAVNAFVLAKRQRLGQDVTLTQLTRAAMVDGVYNVALFNGMVSFADIIIPPNEYAFSTSVTVNIVGTTVG